MGASFVALLKDCALRKDLRAGIKLHDDILSKGLLGKDPYICSTLVSMYAKCGALEKAQRLLDDLPTYDVVSWNAVIAAYAQQGQAKKALMCFNRMQHDGLCPDSVTFSCILKACGSMRAVDEGEHVHMNIVSQGLSVEKDVVLATALIDMYAKCGALTKARAILEGLPDRNVVSWSALIAGYVEQGQCNDALECYERMQCEGLLPSPITLACVLKACGGTGAVDKGKHIHDEIISQGLLEKDIVLGNALVDMYAKCGAFAKAEQALNDLPVRGIICWSALIAGYAQHAKGMEALDCFERMKCEGLSPSEVTFVCALKACGVVKAIQKGKQIHDYIDGQGLLERNIILGNALLDMYAKCSMLVMTQQVFDALPVHDAISWGTLITAYSQQEQGEEALKCFEKMQDEGFHVGTSILSCILKACGSIGAINKGKQIHYGIVSQGLLETNPALSTALVDMYAKCVALAEAHQVLEELPVRDLPSWNAIIAGYAQQGLCIETCNCFEHMQCEGFAPNVITFTCCLNAFNRSGLVDEGQIYLASMNKIHGMRPNIEHQTCMIDLFGRVGHFEEAVALIEKMPSCEDSTVWSAVLGACLKWGNVKVARWAFDYTAQSELACSEVSV